MADSVLDWAKTYAGMGLSVLPLHGKKPYFENWGEAATCDPNMIERWWKQDPRANVGILTGLRSNIFVVDVDPKNGGEETFDTLLSKHGQFPNTWEVVTGSGGKHLYFRYPSFKVGSFSGLFQGIDIRGDGGQVVAPPSIHPETHRRYEWDGLREITEEPIAEAPDWLLEMLQARTTQQSQKCKVPFKIPKGVQHLTLVSFAGTLRKMGLDPEEIYPVLSVVNKRRCEQPGPDENIQQIARSMSKYQPGDQNLFTVAGKLWRAQRKVEVEQQSAKDSMRPVDALSLLRTSPEPPSMIVEGILHNGCTLFAGRPKIGKSWLTLQLAIGVATGGRFLGCAEIMQPGRVGYFALEESESRTASRLHRLVTEPDITLQNITFMYDLKQAGGYDAIERYIAECYPTLVVIDSLTALVNSAPASNSRDVLRRDYSEVDRLSKMAAQHKTAIVLIHHKRKDSTGQDPLDSVAGSTGITAAADCVWTLDRQRGEGHKGKMDIQGREVEEQTYLMELDLRNGIGWNVLATGEEAETSQERQEIIDYLMMEGAKTPNQIAADLRRNSVAVRVLLRKMFAKNQISQNSDGKYVAGRILKSY